MPGVSDVHQQYLVAEKELTAELLRGQLTKKLPWYMIPKSIELTEEIPITDNGKTNRRKLEDQ